MNTHTILLVGSLVGSFISLVIAWKSFIDWGVLEAIEDIPYFEDVTQETLNGSLEQIH